MVHAVIAEVFTISPVVTVLWLASLVFAIFVIVDMANRPGWQWRAAGSNKALWMVLEIVLLIGLLSIVVGVIYLAVVRPRLQAVARQGGAGPWAGGPGQAPWGGQPGQPYPGAGQPWGGAPPGYPGQPQPPVGPPGPWADPGAGAPAGQGFPYGQSPPPPPPPRPVENPPFGWYADPSGRHEKRYWDGTRWTEHVSDDDVRSNDPVDG
ncbi:MAG: DUF2510 domain-containing protein [Acidobacteriota bacterium]|nr:DUF2510 domain-containing protein [Acidobacteriota bacterium]